MTASGSRRRVVVAAAVLTPVYAAVIAIQVATGGSQWIPLVASWLVFLPLAAWIVRGADRPVDSPVAPGARIGMLALAAVSIVVASPGLAVAPQMSTDAYRYVWDGRVQDAGVDPYRYVPLDDHLAPLRDPTLFPGITATQISGVTSPAGSWRGATAPLDTADRYDLTRINRPMVPTIYPPLAQAWFAVVGALTPAGVGTLGLQVSFLLVVAGTTVLIGRALRRAGRDPATAFLYAACPVVVVEASNNAHVDVLAAGLVTAAVVYAGRRWLAGVLLGAAVVVKLTPLLLLPAFLGRRLRDGLATVTATAVTVVAAYLPHVFVVGWLALGYLPGYLSEENYTSGSDRFKVLDLLLPWASPRAVTLVALVLLAAAAIVAAIRVRTEPVDRVAVWLSGWVLLLTTPTYPWYVLPTLALAVLARRYEWSMLALACYGAYAFYQRPVVEGVLFGIAALATAAIGLRRTLHHRRRRVAAGASASTLGGGRVSAPEPAYRRG